MADGSSSSNKPAGIASESEAPAKAPTELGALQKEEAEKSEKIQGLKQQIELAKLELEMKGGKRVSVEKMQTLKSLCDEYNSIRKKYNQILLDRQMQAKQFSINID